MFKDNIFDLEIFSKAYFRLFSCHVRFKFKLMLSYIGFFLDFLEFILKHVRLLKFIKTLLINLFSLSLDSSCNFFGVQKYV